LWSKGKKVGFDHKMLWLEGKKWAKIRQKNGQFLPDFFGHFERCIGVKNGFGE